jgi:hypothetical protein
LNAPSLPAFDLLQETEPHLEKVGTRFRALRGFPVVALRSAHVPTDTPVWLIIGCSENDAASNAKAATGLRIGGGFLRRLFAA